MNPNNVQEDCVYSKEKKLTQCAAGVNPKRADELGWPETSPSIAAVSWGKP